MGHKTARPVIARVKMLLVTPDHEEPLAETMTHRPAWADRQGDTSCVPGNDAAASASGLGGAPKNAYARRMPANSDALLQLVYDRSEIADTLYRYAAGMDRGDAALLASALTEDCVFDFTRAGAKLDLDFKVLTGREAIVATLTRLIGPLDTSHTASNVQVEVNGDTASLRAWVMSQHFLPGDGPRRNTEYALLMNHYQAELARAGDRWLFKHVVIDNAWADGDPTILMAMASLKASRAQLR